VLERREKGKKKKGKGKRKKRGKREKKKEGGKWRGPGRELTSLTAIPNGN